MALHCREEVEITGLQDWKTTAIIDATYIITNNFITIYIYILSKYIKTKTEKASTTKKEKEKCKLWSFKISMISCCCNSRNYESATLFFNFDHGSYLPQSEIIIYNLQKERRIYRSPDLCCVCACECGTHEEYN